MFKNAFNIIGYLDLNHVGLLELLFASSLLLSGYALGSLPMSLLIWVILLMVAFIKYKRITIQNFKPLTIFIVYWTIHEFIIIFLDDVNFNGLIEQVIYFISVFALFPILDYQKLKGSLNWIAIISIVGLLYQWSIVAGGGLVHPIEIPGLSISESRLEVSERPSSFFMEPAAYTCFMFAPIAISLIDHKYIWTAIIVLSVFLTTSTTGMLASFIMLGSFLFTQGKFKKSYILLVLVGAGLMYAVVNFEAFEFGRQKLENTDTENNARLTQGFDIVKTMESDEMIVGVPYCSAYNYCVEAGRAHFVAVYSSGDVFMSTFWLMILRFGIVGLVLYLSVYWKLVKECRYCRPLVVVLVAVLFSSCYFLGCYYVFTLILALVLARVEKTGLETIKLNGYEQ